MTANDALQTAKHDVPNRSSEDEDLHDTGPRIGRLKEILATRHYPYAALALLGLAAFVLIYHQNRAELGIALDNWRIESHAQSVQISRQVELNFTLMYQGLRTLARLPGIRTIRRHAENFSADARTSAQELYNNLAQTVAVSETYIVPADFDPEAIDSATGQLQKPITTFDELILGRNADSAAPSKKRASSAGPEESEKEAAEEIETFEYRDMRAQLAALRAKFSRESEVQALSYPAIVGAEVITCDNSRYSPSQPNDDDRKGFVYSVPFFRTDGNIGGMVSLVLLTHVLREMIPGGQFAIVNKTHDYVAGSKDSGIWTEHRDDIRSGRPAPALLYSEVIPLDIPDISGHWFLWASLPDSDYWNREDVRKITHNMLAQFGLVILAMTLVGLFVRHEQQKQRLVKANAERLSAYATELERSNADLQQFAYVASHDLKEPLRTVASYCQLLQRRYADKLDRDANEFIGFAVDGANRMQALINDLLKYSRVGTQGDPFRPVKCAAALSKAVANLKVAMAETRAVVTADSLPAVLGDEIQVVVLFQNLVANALKFRRQDPVSVHVSVQDRGTDWLFAVRDNGIGFDPAHAERIFVIFQRLHGRDKYPGTGMGLAICKRIVERHGGMICADSEPGVGSTFYFTLPKSGPKKGLT